MEIINLKNVSFKYESENGSVQALNNVNLSIEEGQFIVLLGPNGSGKSTFAKLLNGLLTPTSGSVTVYGYDTLDEDKIYEIRKRVGMVFQNPDNQMIASIVEDDIAFGPENIGIEREEIKRRVAWSLEAVGMSEYRHATPFKMSGGQKQRIAIASILAIKPDVLVLDESTAMLDPIGRAEIMKVIKHLNKDEKMTVILITHFMDEAIEADRVLVMNEGDIILDNTPYKVFSEKAKIEKASLNLPNIVEIGEKLKEKGLPLDKLYFDTDKLAEELCRLL